MGRNDEMDPQLLSTPDVILIYNLNSFSNSEHTGLHRKARASFSALPEHPATRCGWGRFLAKITTTTG